MTIGVSTFIISMVAIIGGFIFGYIKLTKLQKDNEYIKVINLKNSELQQLKNDNKDLYKKIDHLNSIVKELDVAIIRINSVNMTYPFPFMLKDSFGKIVLVNSEWEKRNERTRESVIGIFDYDLYPPDIANKFRQSDYNLINSVFGFVVERDSLVEDTVVIKWRVQGFIKDDNYIAVISVPAQALIDQCHKKN